LSQESYVYSYFPVNHMIRGYIMLLVFVNVIYYSENWSGIARKHFLRDKGFNLCGKNSYARD